jgi:acyl-CoA thioester hydrolase
VRAQHYTSTASTATAYAHSLRLKTRWKDNDMFGHVNNVEYYSYFDTVINDYLLSRGALTLPVALGAGHASSLPPLPPVGVCVESKCTYHESISFPDEIECKLRVAHIGRSSVR